MSARPGLPLLLAAILAAGLSACGDEGGPDASPSGAETASQPTSAPETVPTEDSGLPDCAEVWSGGATLPEDYAGCAEDGEDVEPVSLDCSSGQTIVTYAETYWAVPGATVQETEGLSGDRAFKQARLTCFG